MRRLICVETLDHFHFIPTDADRGMSSVTFPEVDDNLLHFIDTGGEIIIIAPFHQILCLELF